MGRRKRKKDFYVSRLKRSDFEEFCQKFGIHVFMLKRIGYVARTVVYFEDPKVKRGPKELTFYDSRIMPRNEEMEKAWKEYLKSRFPLYPKYEEE